MDFSRHQFAEQLYGSNDPDKLFGRGSITPAPWPTMGRQKDGSHHSKEAIRSALASPPVLEDVDPRHLHASQPNVLREHVGYYMSGEYDRSGRTAADAHVDSNRYPLVYARPNGAMDILAGHHRAAASLLKGEPLRARIVRG